MPGAPRLFFVQEGDVDAFWHIVEPLIERAIQGSDLTADEIRENAKQSLMRLWLGEIDGRVVMAGAVVEIMIGEERVAHIAALSGTGMRFWLTAFLTEFESLAKANGIDRVRLNGRKGWARALRDYRMTAVVLEKRL